METNKEKWMFAISLMFSLNVFSANEVVRVGQVADAVSLTGNVDYMITDETPFAMTGSVDIVNTEHAVVIIEDIRPSKFIADWLDHIFVKGERAAEGVNCQVKMFANGAIVLPYGKEIRPLTCYTEPDYGGQVCSDYTEGHSGGFMKTLTEANLNHKIRSFKLKRGYMVTFALGVGGWGYSRCFIADMEDLEVAEMPSNMDSRVSSYRIFKWQNAKKAGLASSDAFFTGLVNASWGFDWGEGRNLLPDVECVPNHIYEDWPPISVIGSVDHSCHSKNNNEPGNSADDTPQDVEVVLDNWQNVMRTGLRLLSESSHDGSMGHLEAFIDSIDARGWRCDAIDLHCYWLQGQFDNLNSVSDRYGNGRPIWISEWLWGAWWNKNGIFSRVPDPEDFSDEAQQILLDGTRPILEKLNANPRVERYSYWNAEPRTALYAKDGSMLSKLGKYYSEMHEGLAFNRENEFIPKVVYRAPSNLAFSFNEGTRTVKLEWNDVNGDMLDSMVVVCKRPGTMQYERLASVGLKDMDDKNGPSYSYVDAPENGTNEYRIAIYPIGEKIPKYSNKVSSLVISQKAIWNDVTNVYVTNPGFDMSSEFQTVNVPTGSSNHKDVMGWGTSCSEANGCGAVFKVGDSYALNGKRAPSFNAEGEVSGGVLGISQGWGVENYYTQKITLPAGTYRLSYAIYNVANTGEFVNLCGYRIGNHSAMYDNVTSLQPGVWHKSTLNPFTLIEDTDVMLSLGYIPAIGKSTYNPYLFFDYVVLEQADLSLVDDAGEEIVWVNMTDSIFRNPGFDIEADFISSNLAVGTANHKKVTAWRTLCTDAWGCGGVIPVGSGNKVNGQSIPSFNAKGETRGGMLVINQGWGKENTYTQAVTLPEGTYRFSYAVYNMANPSVKFTNRCGYKIADHAAVYDGMASLDTGEWNLRTMGEFSVLEVSEVLFSLGFTAANSTSTSNPFLFFDYIELEKAVYKSSIGTGRESPMMENVLTGREVVYNLSGIRVPKLQKGINIVKYADGSIKKVFVR